MCQSPYIRGGFRPGEKQKGETVRPYILTLLLNAKKAQAPGSSSTGSAVGVAAGFAPLSLGTETSGSLTTPASRAVLYSLKLTPGIVNMEGVWQVSASFDAVGGMAKSTLDLALLSDVLLQSTDPLRPSLANSRHKTCNGISVGFVDIELWRLPTDVGGDVPGYREQSVSEAIKLKTLM